MPSQVSTAIQYLARNELYLKEKPYNVDFEVDESIGQNTNQVLHSQPVSIRAIEDKEKFNIDQHGFCIVKASTSLTLEVAMQGSESIEDAYLSELETMLHKRFPEYSRIEGMEVVVGTKSKVQSCRKC